MTNYKIYRVYDPEGVKKFASYRWWKNYDANNKNGSDIDIETYVKNNGFLWAPLLNSENEPIKYETSNHDTIDEIELVFRDIAFIPEYIKIEFKNIRGNVESAYYYVDKAPSIYNATNNLAVKVKYVLDEFSSYMYKFHNHFKSVVNPQMFFVRKHKNRFLKNQDGKWYVDFNLQPELNFNNEQHDLVVKEKQVNNFDTMITTVIEHLGKLMPGYRFQYDMYKFDEKTQFKCLLWTEGLSSDDWSPYFYINDTVVLNSEDIEGGQIMNKIIFTNEIFNEKEMYNYVITKPHGYFKKYFPGGQFAYKVNADEKFFIWPITNYSIDQKSVGKMSPYIWCGLNEINPMLRYNTMTFKDDNIIGRYLVPISPIILLLLNVTEISRYNAEKLELSFGFSVDYTTSYNFKKGLTQVQYVVKEPNNVYRSQCLLSNGIETSVLIEKNNFMLKMWNLLRDINWGRVSKNKDHNPHLYAPNNFKLVYPASSNNQVIITGDYIDLSKYEEYVDLSLYYSTIIVPEWSSRLLIDNWNDNKQLSQTANEINVSELRQAPISCNAYNNTYLQRQVLDTGRNSLVKNANNNMTFSVISLIAGILATLTGVGTPLGIAGIIGGIAGISKNAINLQNGLAQNEAQKKVLLNQSDTLNNPTSVSGLMSYNTWAEDGLILYTLGLNEMDANKINNDDNMYGYYTNSWLSYANYLECWDGNYMLCDISKNYNALYNELKKINSIYTNNDTYINKFLNALNNGITWFDNGNYVNLATDENNWERVFPRAANEK